LLGGVTHKTFCICHVISARIQFPVKGWVAGLPAWISLTQQLAKQKMGPGSIVQMPVFICSNLYDLDDQLQEKFDIVYAS
jgi:hypothetical protein